jgi:phosphatidylglycerol:prolipoprotein diacylglycerol transferase
MNDTLVHVLFDILAWVAAGAAGLWLARVKHVAFPPAPALSLPYAAAALLGAGVGAVVFGTANLWLCELAGVGRSIEGALAGGILAVEIYKRHVGITARTGARFTLPLAVGIAIGRIGCFLAGLDDFTYGTPTALPWGHDFGDGIPRHPVQLYESAAMTAAALLYVRAVLRHDDFVIANGFYLVVGFYGLQRFAWEFLKPYGTLIGPFTLFHILSAALVAYSVVMIATAPSAVDLKFLQSSRQSRPGTSNPKPH